MIHDVYERLPEGIRGEVDAAFTHATAVLRNAGLYTANNDDAERLVEAIAVFVLASNPKLEAELVERA